MNRTIRRIATAAIAPMLVATVAVAAPSIAADSSATNYSQASDGFPVGAPSNAIWQPTIRAEDLVGFVDTYGADRLQIIRIDGILAMHADWRGIGIQVRSSRDIGAGKIEFVAVGASGRSIGVRVADDVVLTINVRPAGAAVR
jgi:hypothetical protein